MEKRFENMEAFTEYCTRIETALKRNQITETEAMETFFSAAEDYWREHHPEAFPECEVEVDWEDDDLEMDFDPYEGCYTYDC